MEKLSGDGRPLADRLRAAELAEAAAAAGVEAAAARVLEAGRRLAESSEELARVRRYFQSPRSVAATVARLLGDRPLTPASVREALGEAQCPQWLLDHCGPDLDGAAARIAGALSRLAPAP